MKERKDILLALGWYHPQIHQGVLKFAMQHNWRVHSRMAFHKILPENWRGDGILFNPLGIAGIKDFIKKQSQPAVLVCDPFGDYDNYNVSDDKEMAVDLAIQHFQERGFQHYAFIELNKEGDNPRLNLFTDKLIKDKVAVHKIAPKPSLDFTQQQNYILNRIKELPKPLAVLAADDNTAVEFSYTVSDAGFSIPEDVAILGIHNDKLICENAPVNISSVDINFEKIGYEAAQSLYELMEGEKPSEKLKLIKAAGVISRQSTNILVHEHPAVMKAMRYIKQNYCNQILVSAIAEDCGLTTRGLNKAFQKHLGRSVNEEIIRRRLNEARRQLKESKKKKINIIALDCGFGTNTNLYKLFKKHFSMTPKEYRDS